MSYPKIIQGGMGVGVSDWSLARAVSLMGQLGVVSGTALDIVLARRLQNGDLGGHIQRAFENFPFPAIARRVWDQCFIEGGKTADSKFKSFPLITANPGRNILELTVCSTFVEVFLAKEGHPGIVGMNLLEKIQLPTLPSLFGAMLAGVDYILMGAGIPKAIPGILDQLSQGRKARLKLDVAGALQGEETFSEFDPESFCEGPAPELKRPKFLAIISSATLAMTLARKSSGRVDGFVVEGATAGGHNAPPRGTMQLNEKGEPIYGDRDVPDLKKIKEQGLPFWLAGSFGRPGKLKEALELGAEGIQVGTAFAFCEESGIRTEIKRSILSQSRAGTLAVHTDPLASPTGFPFKVVQLEGSVSQAEVYEERERVCDLGYLRHCYRKEDGGIGYRCPAEEVKAFVRKGGEEAEAAGRKCVCNGLFSTIGIPQLRASEEEGMHEEPPLLTAGDDVARIAEFAKPGCDFYSAADVIAKLLAE